MESSSEVDVRVDQDIEAEPIADDQAVTVLSGKGIADEPFRSFQLELQGLGIHDSLESRVPVGVLLLKDGTDPFFLKRHLEAFLLSKRVDLGHELGQDGCLARGCGACETASEHGISPYRGMSWLMSKFPGPTRSKSLRASFSAFAWHFGQRNSDAPPHLHTVLKPVADWISLDVMTDTFG